MNKQEWRERNWDFIPPGYEAVQSAHNQRGQIDVARFFLCCYVGKVIITERFSSSTRWSNVKMSVDFTSSNGWQEFFGTRKRPEYVVMRLNENVFLILNSFNCSNTFAILPRLFSTWFVLLLLLLFYHYYSSYWFFFSHCYQQTAQHGR